EEGIYILIEGQVTVQDCNATVCLMPGELLFARRGNYVVSTGERDCLLLWIPLSVQVFTEVCSASWFFIE
ncbi:[weak similarity to] LscA, partial [methanotrophic bacterial endosymbiont of Bathymodiolus sp.]